MAGDSGPRTTAVVLGLIGLLCLMTGGSRLRGAWLSSGWVAVEGVVLESRLEVTEDAEGSTVTPVVRYRYEVDGTTWISSRISLAQRSLTSDWGRELVERHPPGTRVEVLHDPDQPWEAALFAGVTPVAFVQPAVGVVLVIAALLSLHRRHRSGPVETGQRPDPDRVSPDPGHAAPPERHPAQAARHARREPPLHAG